MKDFEKKTINRLQLSSCKVGDVLQILVENQGRLTYETIYDYKVNSWKVDVGETNPLTWTGYVSLHGVEVYLLC